MTGRHEAPPLGSLAREATAPPYHGRHRAREHCCTHPGTGICMCDCHDLACWCGQGIPSVMRGRFVGNRFLLDHDERAERVADERWSDPEDTHQGGPDDV